MNHFPRTSVTPGSALSNGQQRIEHNGVEICVETFGKPGDAATLLIHGAGASMLYWDAAFCEQLAQADRYVIRYDNRDTGLSTSYPPGQSGYALSDMVADAVAILNTLGISDSQVVGQSMPERLR